MKSPLEALPAQLGELMLRDQQRLRRRLQGARKIKNPDAQLAVAAEVESDIAAARQKCRRAPRLARALPIRKACRSAKKQDILNAIRDHGGDRRRGNRLGENHPAAEDLSGTGARGERPDRPYPAAPRRAPLPTASPTSWKPRSAAASAIRCASTIRWGQYLVKLMTDGILLAEIQQDRLLMQYDTLIIDEAHERSLNIDFILGYLRELLPKRPDLKVIITSATIDPQRFSRHFNNAPIIEVSGRTYPVEVRYRRWSTTATIPIATSCRRFSMRWTSLGAKDRATF